MKRQRFAALMLLILAALPLSAQGKGPLVDFERYRLQNGLEVILHQDQSIPLVAVNVWYHVGAGNETLGKSGFAHLFEHMLFQGSENTGEDVHFNTLKQIGATGVNGTTNSDRTNYYEVVPSHQVDVALWLESDRMGYLLPMLNGKSFANQQEVVRNERRQRYDNRPYGKDRFATSAALYPEGHPYRYLTIGRHEDLASATLEDVIHFYRQWYMPANATLTIAGDFDIDAMKTKVEKWFGTFPASTQPSLTRPETPTITQSSRQTVQDDFAPLRRVHYAWHTPAFFEPGDAEMDILADALTRKGTGRLYKTLVHEKQLAQNVMAYQGSAQFSSAFHVMVDLKPDADMKEVEDLINAEIERLRTEGITEREVSRAVVNIEASAIWRLETLNSRANLLQRYNHYLGDPKKLDWDLSRYRKATPSAIKSIAASFLGERQRVEIITVPADKGGK